MLLDWPWRVRLVTSTLLPETGLAMEVVFLAVVVSALEAVVVVVVVVVVAEAAVRLVLGKCGARVRIGDWGSVVKSVAVELDNKPLASTSSATMVTVGTVSGTSLWLRVLHSLSYKTTLTLIKSVLRLIRVLLSS